MIHAHIAAAALACALTALPAIVQAAATVPSIEITAIAADADDTCSESNLDVAVLLNNPGIETDNYEIYSGATLLHRWTGEHYGGVGPNGYGLGSEGPYPVAQAPNTTLTAIIYTFPSAVLPPVPYTPDKYSYKSAISWNCTTGALVSIENTIGSGVGAIATPVPALGVLAQAALALLLLAAGGSAMRRRNRGDARG